MKNYYIILLTVLALFASPSVYASGAVENSSFVNDSVFYQDGIYYQLIPDKNGVADGALAVIDWDFEMTEINIPEGLYIPEIEAEVSPTSSKEIFPQETRRYKFIIWFRPQKRLISLDDYKVEKILFSMDIDFAPDIDFSVYKYLASLDLPLNMKEIRPRCFKNCKALKSITLKRNIEVIGEEAFQGCTSLVSFSSIDSELRVIGDRAFADCTSLENLNIERWRSISIGSEAFKNCSSLTTVNLSCYISYLSKDAFKGCEKIEKFSIDDYSEDSEYYTYDDCIYRVYNGNRELYIVPPVKRTFVLDSESTILCDRTFYGHKYLSTIYIHDNIDRIGEAVFANCKELKKVRLSERLKGIPDSCFYGCDKLEQVKLPESLESIGKWSFGCCNSISTIEIPTHVKNIDEYAFADCTTLQDFTVSDWNTEFSARDGLLYHSGYKYAYNYSPYDLWLICCPGGKSEVSLDEETVHIEEYSFYGCRKLTSLYIPAKVCVIYPEAFAYCDSLIDFAVSDDNDMYKSIGGLLLSRSKELIAFPGGREEAVLNPYIDENDYMNADYDEIEQNAFYANDKLKKISFMKYAIIQAPNFLACNNITEINLHCVISIDIFDTTKTDLFTPQVYESAQLNVYYDSEDTWTKQAIEESPYWSKFKNINYIETSGIEDCIIDDNVNNKSITIYSIKGMQVDSDIDNLESGIYIIRQGNKTQKVMKL